MIHSFLNLPTELVCILLVLVSSIFSIYALKFLRKRIKWETFRENHEVGGFLFNALGLIYAVLIAFVVYATWSDYTDAKGYCDREANSLQDLFLNSEGLNENAQLHIKNKIFDYLHDVINEDWPMLGIDKGNPKSKEKLIELWKIYLSIDTLKNEKEKILLEQSLLKLNDITDFRRLRILSSQDHIPPVIWTVIIIGALTSIGFSLFFGTRDLKIQAAMTTLFTMTNLFIFYLIFCLDHPFTGDIKIKPDSFQYVLDFLQWYVSKH